MKTPTTHEEIFLTWCEEKGIKVKKTSKGIYDMNAKRDAVLVIQGVKFKLNPIQESNKITVYFDDNGSWIGGTNMLWNTGLPWERPAARGDARR